MWYLTSRVHPLNYFPSHQVQCYVKREDELGCGISGPKLRKYSSLVPYFKQQKIGHLIIIGGPQSNNLLAALQVARELKLKVTAFLIQPRTFEAKGNFKLSLLFLNPDEIIWVKREDWHQVDELAKQYSRKLDSVFILSEGASVLQALPGAMTLADDILRNEREMGLVFDHILIDAGTGFSAAGLIAGLEQYAHPSVIHVLLLADNELVFKSKCEQWTGKQFPHIHCFYPDTAKSFGSVNQAIKKEIRRMAIEEGILVDPVYSAKLFHESRRYIEKKALKGHVLIIHSGGVLTLPGFEL